MRQFTTQFVNLAGDLLGNATSPAGGIFQPSELDVSNGFPASAGRQNVPNVQLPPQNIRTNVVKINSVEVQATGGSVAVTLSIDRSGVGSNVIKVYGNAATSNPEYGAMFIDGADGERLRPFLLGTNQRFVIASSGASSISVFVTWSYAEAGEVLF